MEQNLAESYNKDVVDDREHAAVATNWLHQLQGTC